MTIFSVACRGKDMEMSMNPYVNDDNRTITMTCVRPDDGTGERVRGNGSTDADKSRQA